MPSQDVDYSWTINTNFTALANDDQYKPAEKGHEANDNGAFNFEKFRDLKVNGLKKGHDTSVKISSQAIWAMDCEDGLIVLGCANGRIEVWETLTCQLKVVHIFSKLQEILIHYCLFIYLF